MASDKKEALAELKALEKAIKAAEGVSIPLEEDYYVRILPFLSRMHIDLKFQIPIFTFSLAFAVLFQLPRVQKTVRWHHQQNPEHVGLNPHRWSHSRRHI